MIKKAKRSHPGEVLKELYLEPSGLSVTELSEKLCISRPNMSAIINGRSGISPRMAIKLSKLFNTSAQYWMILQANYEIDIVNRKPRK